MGELPVIQSLPLWLSIGDIRKKIPRLSDVLHEKNWEG